MKIKTKDKNNEELQISPTIMYVSVWRQQLNLDLGLGKYLMLQLRLH